MKRFLLLLVLGVFVLGIIPALATSIGELPRSETLYTAGLQWGPPDNWNPLGGSPDWPINAGAGRNLIYETLFMYNMISGKLEPLIGKEYEWVDNLTLKVTLRTDVHWQDWEPLTAYDVVYTLKLGQRYEGCPWSNIWLYAKDIFSVGKDMFVVKLKPENPNRLVITDALGSIYVLPEHIWKDIEKKCNYDIKKIREFTNVHPVGSGPYTLYYYSPEKVVLKRYDDYWGRLFFKGLPVPKYFVHPVFKSNDDGNLALEKGNVDISQQFVPQIWKMWEKGLPIATWYKHPPYYVPAMTPSLWFNLHKHPLDVPEVRRAIAYCINYEKIALLAMTKYSPTARSSLILPFGGESKYFSESTVKQYGWEYNPEKGEALLKSIGAKKGRDGIYVLKDGTRLGPFKVECPYGWTDWMVSLKIVSQSAKKIGIDIETYFPDTPVWADDRMTGNFDMIMDTPAPNSSPSQPWARFYAAMYSKDVPPIGQLAFRNWGRYKNAHADEILEKIPTITDPSELKSLYKELDGIYMKDIPIIVLEYRPWLFYEYNTSHWTNFPNEDNPYAPPQICTDGAGIRALYKIEPVK